MPHDPQSPTFRDKRFAAFLFDMDGTMLDSSVVVNRVWSEWAVRHGIDPDALLKMIHGVRAIDTIRRFASPGTDAEQEAAALFEAELADVDGIIPIAGILPFLAQLDPNRWAVVTSAPRVLAEARLRAAGIPEPAILIAAEDVTRGKPDPEGFLKAAEVLGVDIANCLVFEDSPAGVAAAKASGARVAIVGDLVTDENAFVLSDYLEDADDHGTAVDQ